MTTQSNNFGQRYDDMEPCFMITNNGMIFNRLDSTIRTRESMADYVDEIDWDLSNRELGYPSQSWQQQNTRGWVFSTGIVDTENLASEMTTNGEDFTGASGSTPPDGWYAVGTAPQYSTNEGPPSTITITNDDGSWPGIGVYLTTEVGKAYIVEVGIAGGQGDIIVTAGPERTRTAPNVKVFITSFVADEESTQLQVMTIRTGTLVADYVRVYPESEMLYEGVKMSQTPEPERKVVVVVDEGGDE